VGNQGRQKCTVQQEVKVTVVAVWGSGKKRAGSGSVAEKHPEKVVSKKRQTQVSADAVQCE